jgi:hypothetical protein
MNKFNIKYINKGKLICATFSLIFTFGATKLLASSCWSGTTSSACCYAPAKMEPYVSKDEVCKSVGHPEGVGYAASEGYDKRCLDPYYQCK